MQIIIFKKSQSFITDLAEHREPKIAPTVCLSTFGKLRVLIRQNGKSPEIEIGKSKNNSETLIKKSECTTRSLPHIENRPILDPRVENRPIPDPCIGNRPFPQRSPAHRPRKKAEKKA